MLKRLKEKWESYTVIVAILFAGYMASGYVHNIKESNKLMYEAAIRHSDKKDSLWRVEWRGTENIEEGRYQAAERHRNRTETALEYLDRDISRFHYGIQRDLKIVAETQADAIMRDSIRRSRNAINRIETRGL